MNIVIVEDVDVIFDASGLHVLDPLLVLVERTIINSFILLIVV